MLLFSPIVFCCCLRLCLCCWLCSLLLFHVVVCLRLLLLFSPMVFGCCLRSLLQLSPPCPVTQRILRSSFRLSPVACCDCLLHVATNNSVVTPLASRQPPPHTQTPLDTSTPCPCALTRCVWLEDAATNPPPVPYPHGTQTQHPSMWNSATRTTPHCAPRQDDPSSEHPDHFATCIADVPTRTPRYTPIRTHSQKEAENDHPPTHESFATQAS